MRGQAQLTSPDRDTIALRELDEADAPIGPTLYVPAADGGNRHRRWLGAALVAIGASVSDPPADGAALFEGVPILEVPDE